MRRSLIVLFVLLLISIAAFWQVSKGKRNQNLQGIYLVAFERSDFYPNVTGCPPSGTRYWLDPSSNPEFSHQLRDLPDDGQAVSYRAVYLRFVGDVSGLGQHGHLGQYWREVEVTKLLEIKKVDGCP